ncbi:MAG: hypothetical protein C0594_01280 [Marinilabiliales bacterium]|nr:MAG: hypothetical protein C0594_01280 [Marinilabiliales bacterium]
MSKRGYYIDKTLSCTSESFYRFMEIASTSELIQESLKENKELFSLVSYESTGDLIGIQLLSKLLLAIRESRVIKFVHENFYTGRIGDFEIKPYFLKEYQSRWYIIGEVDWDKKFWNFGVDRIQDLEITDKVFKRKKADLEKLYEHTIGLNFNEPKPERVELLFNEIQIKYVRALQLHESQIEGETKDGFTAVDLYVRPNYEFMQKILMMGDGVEVIKPKWFRDQVKKVLKDTLSKYKK